MTTPSTREPPRSLAGILRCLGPGLILTGAIVGSGELIATTKVGAESGFSLLWLIVLGCLVKVFTQIELGRHTLRQGKTTLAALNDLPGPRWLVHWSVWLWLIMTALVLTQLGGIVGGVGQALAVTQPLTDAGQRQQEYHAARIRTQVHQALLDRGAQPTTAPAPAPAATAPSPEPSADPALWATAVAVPTALMLVFGRYGLIQAVASVIVAGFTLLTVVTLVLLQLEPDWAVQASELRAGLRFELPAPRPDAPAPLATALAAFGIIGVGAQ